MIDYIKDLCKQRGWTYYRLAQEAGIPHSSMNSMLNKQHMPSTENLVKVCSGFGLTLSEFFAGIEARDGVSPNTQRTQINEVDRLWYLLDNDTKRFLLGYMYGATHQTPPDNEIPLEDDTSCNTEN